jgi:hypothetical protein
VEVVDGREVAYWVLAVVAFAGCVGSFVLLRGVNLAVESEVA